MATDLAAAAWTLPFFPGIGQHYSRSGDIALIQKPDISPAKRVGYLF